MKNEMSCSELIYKGHVTLGVSGDAYRKIQAADRLLYTNITVPGGNDNAIWIEPKLNTSLIIGKAVSYDNALLILAYLEAFQHTRRPLYETVVRRTAEYVLRELEAPAGGFYCGQDADSEGVEGTSIPNQIGQQDIDTEPDGMNAIREQLRAYRLKRTALHKDDKILTAWNGLMIAALAKAGLVLDESKYLDAAKRTAGHAAEKRPARTDRAGKNTE